MTGSRGSRCPNSSARGDLYSIQDDANGNLWLSSNQGLYRVAKRQLLDAADGGHASLDVRRYSELDGLRRTEFNGAGLNAGWKSSDGRLWFPTIKGVVVIDPDRLQTNPLSPPVFIGRLLVDGHEVAAGTRSSLPPRGGGLEIHYTATSLQLPERVTFRYRLEGYDEGWVDAGHRRVAYYTGLPGGRYRFRVIAANSDGVWNETGDSLDVRIKPRYHETLWFYALVVLLVIGLGAGLVRLRLRVAHKQSRALTVLVEERTAELRTSEERYRELFDSNPLPVWVYALDTLSFLAVNDAAIRHYGYSRAEFLGLTLTEIRPLEEIPAFLEEIHKPGGGRDQVWHHLTKDGTVIAVELMAHPIQFEGRAANLVVVFDVTGRRDLEERLRQAQKMEAIGQLTGGIAHDLNNVLTAVIAHVEFAAEALQGQPELMADLTQAQTAAHRGAGIIRKLLGFGRRERLIRTPLDLGGVIGELAGTLRRLLPTHIEIHLSVGGPLPSVLADAGSVQQILLNLTTNARDAMPGGGRLGIEVGPATLDSEQAAAQGGEPGAYVVVTVSDSGTGMDDGTKARIFEPFFTTKPQGQGTGLGMAMVYGLMKQHRGHVALRSEPGLGTRVELYFPASGDAVPVLPPKAKATLAGGHETILVVEDEASVRTVATRALERHGYRVITAMDGEEGLRLWREHAGEIELVISDAIMPHMGGLELFEAVSRECPTIRFLLSSGYTGQEVAPEGDLRHRLAFLQKPWSVDALLAKVRETLTAGPPRVPWRREHRTRAEILPCAPFSRAYRSSLRDERKPARERPAHHHGHRQFRAP
jgi:PAS domain S-box-containing protein